MNRNEEYWALIAELGDTPPELEGTVRRARDRARKASAGRWFGIPVASLGGVAAAFVLLVNCSTPFAMACRRVPLVRELAEAVAFDPSLKAAMENDYLQYVGQTQTKDGVAISVDYLIVDDTQLNIFYKLQSEGGTIVEDRQELLDSQGERLDGYAASWGSGSQRDEDKYLISTFHFFDDSPVPSSLRLHIDTYDTNYLKSGSRDAEVPAPPSNGPWPRAEDPMTRPGIVASFDFDLTIDPGLIDSRRTIAIDRWLGLDGQRIYVDSLTVSPTFMEFTLREDPANTALLKGLDSYAEDERGNRYERPSVTYGDGLRVQLESSYFSNSERLTLYITSAQWLDKNKTSFTLDLATGQADWLPEGVSIESVERRGDNAYLAVKTDNHAAQFHWNYHDPEGGEHEWGDGSSGFTDRDGDGYREEAIDYRVLRDYPWDTVTIDLSSNRRTEFPEPLTVPIR